MEAIVSRSAGIDIGRATLKATVRVQCGQGRKTRREVRTFGTTGQLLTVRDWLVAEGVTLVEMASTGVWRPVCYILDDVAACWLLNAQHLTKVPGSEEPRQRFGVDRGAGGARPGAAELCAAARYSAAAGPDPVALSAVAVVTACLVHMCGTIKSMGRDR